MRAFKTLVTILLELGLPCKYLSDKLVGLAEMLYYSPCNVLSSSNLMLSKAYCAEIRLQQIPMTDAKSKIVQEYATIVYDIFLNLSHESSKLKTLLWLLQLTNKFTDEGDSNEEYRRLFNEARVIIDSYRPGTLR